MEYFGTLIGQDLSLCVSADERLNLMVAWTKLPTQRIAQGELRIAVQCKVTGNGIKANMLREFKNSLRNARMHNGSFVASSGFTKDNFEEVAEFGYAMDLFDYAWLTNQLRLLVDKT